MASSFRTNVGSFEYPETRHCFGSPLAAMALGQLDASDSDLSDHRCNTPFVYTSEICHDRPMMASVLASTVGVAVQAHPEET